jgi:hypothetical protein
MTDVSNIQGLDLDAWNRWVAYRSAIKKPFKEISLHPAALKLAKYGADQAEVVDQSISNQWQGLFDLKKKRDPAEPPQKTDKQKAADNARFEWQAENNEKMWQEQAQDALGKLRLCDALLAIYQQRQHEPDTYERMQWLKSRAAELIQQAPPAEVISDPHIRGLVRYFWNEAGVARLREKAA